MIEKKNVHIDNQTLQSAVNFHQVKPPVLQLSPFKTIKGTSSVLIAFPYANTIDYFLATTLNRITSCHAVYHCKHSEGLFSDKAHKKLVNLIKKEKIETVILVDLVKNLNNTVTIESNQNSPLTQGLSLIMRDHGLSTDVVENNSLTNFDKTNTIQVKIPEKFITEETEHKVHALLPCLSAIAIFLENIDTKNNNQIHPFLLSTKRGSIFPHHRVDLSQEMLEALDLLENDYVTVINPVNGLSRRCLVQLNNTLSEEEIRLTLSTKKKLLLQDTHPSFLLIQKYQKYSFLEVKAMNVTSIKDGKVMVSKSIYDSLDQEQGCEFFEVMNGSTGASFDIHKSKIDWDSTLKDNEIKLSFIQRQFLDYELPPDTLSSFYFQRFCSNAKDDAKIIEGYYANEKALPKIDYLEREKIKKILKKTGYINAHLIPLREYKVSKREPLKKFVTRKISEFIIRQERIQLKVIRPYSTDEPSNIVRVSENSLKLLGLEETDNITISNRSNKVTARVLVMNSLDLARETNIVPSESNLNVSIGIPAHIRSDLGLKHIGKVIEIERDLGYLFRKNLNMQFFSMMAAILTTFTIPIPFSYKIMLICVLLPLSIYISFSKLRESISND
ncbi:hypothetical protein [Bacillus sp. FJAT-45350]|uniref:hypothetical protein n=1 Tax=Bacillus sp. FJAT-45350 TaxID=2011014 RepID=UPI000BB71842|nr:hypothetical protein [Bacillus sp. FJAT-45350]